jgi:hypothetical protein
MAFVAGDGDAWLLLLFLNSALGLLLGSEL